MPKTKRRSTRSFKRTDELRGHLRPEQKQRGKENSSNSTSGSGRLVTDNDPIMSCVVSLKI